MDQPFPIPAGITVCFRIIGQVLCQIGVFPVLLFLLPMELVVFYITAQFILFQIFIIITRLSAKDTNAS